MTETTLSGVSAWCPGHTEIGIRPRLLARHVLRMTVIAGGLALMGLLGTAGLAAASDPIVSLPDAPLTSSGQTSSLEAPEPLEPSLPGAPEPSEPTLTGELAPTLAPVLGGLSIDPVPPPQTLLAPLTELVAEQVPDGLDAVTPLLEPAVQTLGRLSENGERPTTADRSPSSSRPLALDSHETVVDATDVSRPPARNCVGDPMDVLAPFAVSSVAAGAARSECSNSITDLNPLAAVITALAAGGAGARILALRMPPNPTDIWLAEPVPPG